MSADDFVSVTREMSPRLLYKIARQANLPVPVDVSIYKLPEYLDENMDAGEKTRAVNMYRDAGNTICNVLTLPQPAPQFRKLESTVRKNSESPDVEAEVYEDKPYLLKTEVDENNKLVKLRFRYYKGRFPAYDQKEKRIQYFPLVYKAVAIVRPERRICEIRCSHGVPVIQIAHRMAIFTNNDVPKRANLYSESKVRAFLDWISSLNSAKFEFGPSRTLSAMSMTARGKLDLRDEITFRKYFSEGQLRGGHVTIKDGEEETKFRIFFRDCRLAFTSMSSEAEISYVMNSLERITKGEVFPVTHKLIEFIGKGS